MKLTENKYFKWFLGAVLLLLILFALHWCNSNPQQINEPIKQDNSIQYHKEDSIQYLLNEWAKDKHFWQDKNDSLTRLLFKRIKHKTTVKDSLILITDTNCMKSLIVLYNECERVDSIYTEKINGYVERVKKDSIAVNDLYNLVDIKQTRISKDSLYLTDSIPLVLKQKYKQGLNKGRKEGGVIGLGVGVIGGILLVK